MSIGGGGKQRASKGEIMAAELAKKEYARFKEAYMPNETRLRNQVDNADSERKQHIAKGDIASESNKFNPSLQGLNVNSGTSFTALKDQAKTSALVKSGGFTDTVNNLKQRKVQGQQDMVNLGQNLNNNVGSLTSAISSLDNSKMATKHAIDSSNRMAALNAVGTLAGASGQQYYSNKALKTAETENEVGKMFNDPSLF